MDFETTEQALETLDNVADSMAPHAALASLVDVQRKAVAFLRKQMGGEQATATAAKKPRR